MKFSATVVVQNNEGIHARPASIIARTLQDTPCQISFILEEKKANAKSVIELLMLCAPKNSKIEILVEGEGGEFILEKLIQLFNKKFQLELI